MIIPQIDSQLSKLIKYHGTRNPYQIAKERNILIIEEDLGEIYGYYNRLHRIQFIHLNRNMCDHNKLYTCSHELGHAICHPSENTPQLSSISVVSEMRVEKEADYFATKLIMDGSHKELFQPTKYEILDYYGLPWYLDRYM